VRRIHPGNAGNRLTKLNSLNSVTEGYTYDPLYQLTQVVQGATTTESYGYDAVGNKLSSLGVSPYNYNSSNELTSTPSGSYTYDNNGNTLTDPSGKSYTWDFENRLTQVVVPGTGTVTFKYDPWGRRVQKSSPSGTINYLYDGLGVTEELDSAGNILAKYTHETGMDRPLAELRFGATSYYQQDGINTVTSLSSSAGVLANTYTYNSFGKLSASTGTIVNPLRYTGREFDAETGIYYYRARYYDPSAGCFLSEDPTWFRGGVDFYTYVAGNPVNFSDPLGLQHSPGGPDHPRPGFKFGCKETDDCSTLSWKIDLFEALMAGHKAWDVANKQPGRHDEDIESFGGGLANCVRIHQKKCTGKCPKFEPVPAPQPFPAPPPIPPGTILNIGTIGIIIIIIIFSPVGA